MQPIELDNRGMILTYTVLQMPPEGFEPPLMMALVKLERDSVVLCLLEEGIEAPELGIGTQVELSLDKESRLRFTPTA